MQLSRLSAILLAASLAACAPSPPAPDAGASTAPAPAEAAATAPAGTPATTTAAAPKAEHGALWFEPAALSACGAGKDVATVSWDATGFPGVTAIKVIALEKGGLEGNFAAAGNTGSKQSGPWMHAGTTMVLRDAATGKELARAVMGSVPCP
jgi:hypothetical protein